MRLSGLAVVAMAMAPASVSATVMLNAPAEVPAPCYSDGPACDRSIKAPLRRAGDAGAERRQSPAEPAVAALVGLAILGAALGRRRAGLPQVVS